MFSDEIMRIVLLAAVALVGVMVAVNSVGKVRQSINWLLATILCCGTGVVVADYWKSLASVSDEATYHQRLADEKNELAQRAEKSAVGATEMGESELKVNEAEQLRKIVDAARLLADTLASVNMDDYTLSDALRVSNAADRKRAVESLKVQYASLKPQLVFYRDNSVASALEKLDKSALYAKLYYTSTDSDQEAVRERVMRTSAVAARELLVGLLKKLDSAK